MEDEAEVIKQQMEETRTSLSDKLEKLEQQVTSTVQQATGAVAETVESVKEAVQGTVEAVQGTVGAVKDTVQDTVDSMKETVADTVESVKETFNLSRQVEEHPWAMLGGSVAAGFLLGRFVPMPSLPHAGRGRSYGNGRSQARYSFAEGQSTGATASAVPPASGGGTAGTKGWDLLHTLTDALAPALDTLKGMAIGTTTGVLGELVLNAVPEDFKGQVREAINEITTKLGGRKVWEPGQSGLFQSSSQGQQSSGHASAGAGEAPRRW